MEFRKCSSSRLSNILHTQSELLRRITDYRIKLDALSELIDNQMSEIEQRDHLIEELKKKNARESEQYKRRISYLEAKQSQLSQRCSQRSSRLSNMEIIREPTTLMIELDINRRDIEVVGQRANGHRIPLGVERDNCYSYQQEEESTVYGEQNEDDPYSNLQLEISFM